MLAFALFTLFGLATTITAVPMRQNTSLSAQNLIEIAPKTESCTTNADPKYPNECATAAVAAPNIVKSFQDYSITNFNIQATLVALMLFESGHFAYSKHHFPSDNPGQGTRNMQSYEYNLKYANYLAADKKCGITTEKVAAAEDRGPDDVLALVNTDHLGFGSAAWFLRTQCDASIEQGLAIGTEEAFNNYLVDCLGTSADPERTEGWTAVMNLKHW